jgi:hypothetical protein
LQPGYKMFDVIRAFLFSRVPDPARESSNWCQEDCVMAEWVGHSSGSGLPEQVDLRQIDDFVTSTTQNCLSVNRLKPFICSRVMWLA